MKTCPQCKLRYPMESASCFIDGSLLMPLKDTRLGATVAGRYVLEQVIGLGGMATVYRARYRLIDRPCAVKVLASQFAQDAKARERFRREARNAQRLSHENIIRLVDHGETEDNTPFLVMELLRGRTLADAIAGGRLALSRCLPIAVQIARALACAHDLGVVHRDLKPENVILLQGDKVKLLDFGIARSTQDTRLTGTGELCGTPQYMAPERTESRDSGPAADLYAFGVILFEMVTSSLPFDAPYPALLLQMHVKQPVPALEAFAPDAPAELGELVRELMSKTPEGRPVDAHHVEAALVRIAEHLSIPLPAAASAPPEHALSLQPSGMLGRWARRMELFDRMLERAFGGALPAELDRVVETMRMGVREMGGIIAPAIEEQRVVDELEQEAFARRFEIGQAIGTLHAGICAARQQARSLRADSEPLTAAVRALGLEARACHRDVVKWEGRSGFAEPYVELAAAYRNIAGVVEGWHAARMKEQQVVGAAVDQERLVAEVDQNIREQCRSLATFDKAIEDRCRRAQAVLGEMGRRVTKVETDLVVLASRLCSFLRMKPELGQLFAELEREAVTPAPVDFSTT